MGEVIKAIEFYQQQLLITRELGDRRSEGNAFGNLGNAYVSLRDVNTASVQRQSLRWVILGFERQ